MALLNGRRIINEQGNETLKVFLRKFKAKLYVSV
jgi:hypothetical protein